MQLKAQAILITLLIPIYGFSASLNSMTKDQVFKSIVNKSLVSIGVDNLNGKTVNNSNSVYLGKGGIVHGKMGHKPPNLPQYDAGRYNVGPDGTVYIKWNKWDESQQLCFHIFETKNAYITVDCRGLYHSTFMKSDIKAGNQL